MFLEIYIQSLNLYELALVVSQHWKCLLPVEEHIVTIFITTLLLLSMSQNRTHEQDAVFQLFSLW